VSGLWGAPPLAWWAGAGAEVVRATAVVSNATVWDTFGSLLPAGALPPDAVGAQLAAPAGALRTPPRRGGTGGRGGRRFVRVRYAFATPKSKKLSS